MFVQTEVTPNPNSLKFLPGKNVSNSGPYEITNKDQINNELVKNILSVNGVEGVFLGKDFISVNKSEQIKWDEIKHIVISFINDFYTNGKEEIYINARKVKAIDTTGAGDAFNGSFSFGLSKGKSIRECLELANRVAGLSTTRLGAGDSMPKLTELL